MSTQGMVRVTRDERIALAAEARGSGAPLVFVHGLTGNRGAVLEQFEPLLDRYRLITYDQRGHGDSSPVTDPNLYDSHAMATDMGAVMDAFGVDRAVVGGESMGAATALLFALSHPERVEMLLLTAPAFADSRNREYDRIVTMGTVIAERGIEGYIEWSQTQPGANLLPEIAHTRIVARLRSHDGESLSVACKTVMEWIILPDLSVLSEFPRPVCLIAWPNDALHPINLAKRMANTFPDATVHEHSLAGHFADPTAAAVVYARFLAARMPPRA